MASKIFYWGAGLFADLYFFSGVQRFSTSWTIFGQKPRPAAFWVVEFKRMDRQAIFFRH